MLFKSALVTETSGSIGGMTASRNKGGPYLKARSLPTNPNTPQQQAAKLRFGFLSNAFVNLLSSAQRAGWQTYAENVLITNVFGEGHHIPAIAQYIRSNAPRLQCGFPRIDDAPGIFNIGDYTAPFVDAPTADDATINLNFTNTDSWAQDPAAGMLFWISRPYSPAKRFFKGPFQFAGVEAGTTPDAPASPAVITLPFDIPEAGAALAIRFNVTHADGRLSQDGIMYTNVV